MSYKGEKSKQKQEPIIDSATDQPTSLARQIERKLLGIRGRRQAVELPSVYEEVALVVFDFEQRQPKLHATFPDQSSPLRIERFFDELVGHFRRRNTYIP